MNILIIGSGGREHAIAWKAAQSKQVHRIFVAPGNAGTQFENKCQNIAIDPLDFSQLIQFAKENHITLTIVGPEAPLAAGIVDAFHAAKLACFGPSQLAAELEASKAYCKNFLKKYHVPTANYAIFHDPIEAKSYAAKQSLPMVIKASGLAAGKGVVIAKTFDDAYATIDEMFHQKQLGSAGQTIVIEEFLLGEEVSFIVVSDGEHVVPLASSQDHKTRDDGDKGPNTGGMGAYSPAPIITPALEHKILDTVIYPTIKGMAQEGRPFIGFLYAGLMISSSKEIKVLEFNCRLGDPETQVLLFRLKSDFVDLCIQALAKNLKNYSLAFLPQSSLGVVVAAQGYPGHYQKNNIIAGLDSSIKPYQKIFHAGTKIKDHAVVTQGGRVLCACALGDNLTQAQRHAYALIQNIHFDGMFYRHDIGTKGLNR